VIGQSSNQRGFTLIELMVVIIIAAILLTIAVPSFSTLIKRNNVDSLQSKLSSALATARTEAASRNKVVTICHSDDESTCSGTWSDGWIVFEDNDYSKSVTTGDVLIDVYRNSGQYTIDSGDARTSISFNAQGFIVEGDAMLLTICEPDKELGYARGLFVNKSGLVMKTKDSDGDGKHNRPNPESGEDPNLSCP
jgi:type IV fimbrial biogenesis protein FimT